MNAFEELISSLTDEGDRKVLETLGSKYPTLKEGVLRQSDYSRKLDEFKREKADALQWKQKLDEWDQWKQDNWDEEHGMTKAQKFALDEVERLKELGGEDMDFAKLADWTGNFVKEKGLIDKTTLEATLSEKEKQINSGFEGHAYVSAKIPHLIVKHLKEFDEVLDPQDVLKKAGETKEYDLDRVYEGMVSERREKIKAERLNAQIEEAKKAGFEEGKKLANQNTPMPSPTDQGSPELRTLQDRVLGKQGESEDKYAGLELGRNEIAYLAAKEFIEGQK